MSFIPKPHEIYKHFKGNLYQVIAVAEHSETGEQLVIYQALYGDYKIYARPFDMFVSKVDKEKYPDVLQEFRFQLQGPDSERQKEVSDCEKPAITGEILPEEKSPEDTCVDDTAERKTGPVEKSFEEEKETGLDPMLLEFLDADNYEQRLNILAGLHHRITDEMITTMAIACDIEVNDGELEDRYEALKSCLITLEKYECNRLR